MRVQYALFHHQNVTVLPSLRVEYLALNAASCQLPANHGSGEAESMHSVFFEPGGNPELRLDSSLLFPTLLLKELSHGPSKRYSITKEMK